MTTLTAEISTDTAEALENLAPLLHPEAADPLALLLQDALRSYVWIVRQQLNERVVASISQETKVYLEAQPDAPDDIAMMLVRYIPAESFEHVRSALAAATTTAPAADTDAAAAEAVGEVSRGPA